MWKPLHFVVGDAALIGNLAGMGHSRLYFFNNLLGLASTQHIIPCSG